jgi:hypothetical protein
VDSVGDVTVAYLVILGNNVTTESMKRNFGYGRKSSALQDKAHEAYNGSRNQNPFEADTLVMDVIDQRHSSYFAART